MMMMAETGNSLRATVSGVTMEKRNTIQVP